MQLINKTEFVEFIADILEVESDSICFSTNYREDIEDWDSLKGFMIITNIEDELDVFIRVEAFETMQTIGELYHYIQTANEK